MTSTVIGTNDPKAIRRYSAGLAVDAPKQSYWDRKFVSRSETPDAPLQEKPELESDAGDKIQFDLSMEMRQTPTEGDNKLEGKHENLRFYTDSIMIDQMRGAVSSGGAMTRKRTIHDLRKIAKARAAEWWGRVKDELVFMYLSGTRGANDEFIFGADYAGFAKNAFTAPDTDHQMYGGDAVSKATLDATDKMSRGLIERAVTRAAMLKTLNADNVRMTPIKIDGEEHFVVVMGEFQAFDLRNDAGAGWLDIQKAAAAAEGRGNPIFKGGLGMINNVVLHKHESVIRFTDYGAGANVEANRALFMGAQAGLIAYGDAGSNLRYNWKEELIDFGNELVVATGCMFGVKKTRFNGRDFGVISLDTAAKNPN